MKVELVAIQWIAYPGFIELAPDDLLVKGEAKMLRLHNIYTELHICC